MARQKNKNTEEKPEPQQNDAPEEVVEQRAELTPDEMVIKALDEANTLVDLNKAQELAMSLFPDGIPDLLSEKADAKYKQITAKSQQQKSASGVWQKLSDSERAQAEKEGRLAGWNPRTKEGLLSK